MGDKFAHNNKLVSFYQPEQTINLHPWVGRELLIGVLSGMNETGLTVTINSCKIGYADCIRHSHLYLTREILQYASTIDEAYAIARLKNICFRIHTDRFCAGWQSRYLEKSPEKTALFTSSG